MDPFRTSQLCLTSINTCGFATPLDLSLCCHTVFLAGQLQQFLTTMVKMKSVSCGLFAGDGCQEGLHSEAGKPWHAILHKKKVIGLLIALRGMFHRPSQFPGLPSAAVQVRCQAGVIWPEHETDWRKRQLDFFFLRLPLNSITLCLQLCLSPSGGTLLSSQTHQLVNC